MASDVYYAHTLPEPFTKADWERLSLHLQHVATGKDDFPGAAGFAKAFDSEDWGRLAGLWHDLGKYDPRFQAKLCGEAIQVEHAGVGAALAHSLQERNAIVLCFIIAGHHAGLANASSNESARGVDCKLPRPLIERLRANVPVLAELRKTIPPEILNLPLPPVPEFLARLGKQEDHLRPYEFWTRMLFSSLVDADRLATAAFYCKYDASRRSHDELRYDSIPALKERIDTYIDRLPASASGAVQSLRAQVLNACRSRATESPGRFSLTVPTGGGKTLSAMSFALRHAQAHGLRRVIIVIPFTSIIEQNAGVYCEALGDDNVLEHHSNLDEQRLEEEQSEREVCRKLAAENWDAPIVVTTTVQFFESLFSNHPSRCRKLHNIAKSVIILDEVQTLPPQFLDPILDALAELTTRYGSTVVLSTATPPALMKREGQKYGLTDVREIMPDVVTLASSARRVRISWPQDDQPLPYAELAKQLEQHSKVLAIVHRRRDARDLARMLPSDDLFHLSALMCPAHRLRVLEMLKVALKESGPCRLVATQLVEAGVDIDFPVVYRAMSGIDSLAQAAGRCDREGKLTEAAGEPGGRFIVFRAETSPPPGSLRRAMQTTETLLGLDGSLDPFSVRDCERYFREFYDKHDLDAEAIQRLRSEFNFATVATKFRLIDNAWQRPLVVPWEDSMERVKQFRRNPNRVTQKALQPFIVQISATHHAAYLHAGLIEPVGEWEQLFVPTDLFGNRYDPNFGLDPGDARIDPELMTV